MRFPKKEFFEKVKAEVEEIEKQNPGCTRTFVVKELRKKPFPSGKSRSVRTCEDYVKWVWLDRTAAKTIEVSVEEVVTAHANTAATTTEAALVSMEVFTEHCSQYVQDKEFIMSAISELMSALAKPRVVQAYQTKVELIEDGLSKSFWCDSRLEAHAYWWFRNMGEPIKRYNLDMDCGYGNCRPDFYLPRLKMYLEMKTPANPVFVKSERDKFLCAAQLNGQNIMFIPHNLEDFLEDGFKGIHFLAKDGLFGQDRMCYPAICKVCNQFYPSFGPTDKGICKRDDCTQVDDSYPRTNIPAAIRQALSKNFERGGQNKTADAFHASNLRLVKSQ